MKQRPGQRVLLAARTAQERRRQRVGLRLKDFTIAAQTRKRYEAAVSQILPFLESQPSLADIDGVVADWVDFLWSKGTFVAVIADTLSGLHWYWPELKGHLRHSWKMFKSWRRIETPARAAPLTPVIVRAMVARAVELNYVSLAFHVLMRTGELLQLRAFMRSYRPA